MLCMRCKIEEDMVNEKKPISEKKKKAMARFNQMVTDGMKNSHMTAREAMAKFREMMRRTDSEVIRTRTGRSILRFRSDEKMIADVYVESEILGVTVSQFLRQALNQYLANIWEIRKQNEVTKAKIRSDEE